MKRLAVFFFVAVSLAGAMHAESVNYNGGDINGCEGVDLSDKTNAAAAIMACTRLIQAATDANDRGSLQEFYTDRGEAYLFRDDCSGHGECDLAIGDLTRVLGFSPEDQEILGERAIAYDRSGQWAKAIADRRKELKQDDAGLDSLRLTSEYLLGRDEFVIGRYPDSARDLASFVSDPHATGAEHIADVVEAVLWLHLARTRAGQIDIAEFSQNAAPFAVKDWPGPIFQLYLRKMTENEALAAAPKGDTDAACFANFWVGEFEMLRKDKGAARHLANARSLCWAPGQIDDPYYTVAAFDLLALRKSRGK